MRKAQQITHTNNQLCIAQFVMQLTVHLPKRLGGTIKS